MKRKKPHSHHPQYAQYPPQQNPYRLPLHHNSPGPSIQSLPPFIPLSNGFHGQRSQTTSNHHSKMKTHQRSNQAYSPYQNNKQNRQPNAKQVNSQTPVSICKSSKPDGSISTKGTSQNQEANSTLIKRNELDHSIEKKDRTKKVDVIEKKESADKKVELENNEVVVIDDSSPSEQSSSKRRKIITIDSDDKEKSHTGHASSSHHDQESSNKRKDSRIPHKYCIHLTSALRNYHSDHLQDKAFLDRKLFLRDGVQRIISKNFGEGVLHLTGSSMSGFGTLKSDADMALVFDPSLNTISKKKARNVITRLASCLRRQAFCANVEMIFAKVPIIKFFDKISRCDVDININNTVGIKNSFLLKSISLVDTRIPPLVIAVKAWAKSHDINSAYQGSLSSYLLVTMIIYFLQTGLSPPLLPPLKQYVDNLQSVNVNTQLQHFVPRTFIRFDVRNKEELGEIFVKFFQFWVKKFRQNKVFSVYTGQEAIRTYNTPFLDTSAYVLVLEEPFQKDNIARAVRPQQFGDVKEKFQQACDKFKDIASFEEVFGSATS